MLGVAFLLSLASQGANSVAVVYARFRYDLTPFEIGALLTAFAVASLGVQGFLVRPIQRAFGARSAMLSALGSTGLGLLGLGLAKTGIAFSLCMPLLALGSLSGPIMAGYFSGAMKAEEQGRLQGAWGSVNSLMGLLAPGLFTLVFAGAAARPSSVIWGAPFILSAVLIAAAVWLGARAAWPPQQ
jgi:DHA1 family tetracycline resistance protein-like MFS transporter